MPQLPYLHSPVMTVLEAHVSADCASELVGVFEHGKGQIPPQMLGMSLAQSDADPTLWRAISVWKSREALAEYRRSVATPPGIAMFRSVGSEPALSIWSVPVSATAAVRQEDH